MFFDNTSWWVLCIYLLHYIKCARPWTVEFFLTLISTSYKKFLSCLYVQDFLMYLWVPHLDDLYNLVFWNVQMKLTIRLLEHQICSGHHGHSFVFCVDVSAFFLCALHYFSWCYNLAPMSFPYQLTGLEVKANHVVQSIEVLLICLGTALPCLEGRGMEIRLRLRQDSEGDLRTWLELLLERHIIELSLPATVPVGKPAS